MKRSPFFWMALASLGFAFMNVFARLAHGHAYWAEVAAVRVTVGGLVAFGVARARGASLGVTNQKQAWVRSIFGSASVASTFYVLGSPQIDLGDVATIGATSPIIIALLAPLLLKEKSSPRLWVCALLSFTGVVVIAQPKLATAGHLVVIMLAAAVSSALAMIALRRVGPKESPEAIALHFSVVTSVTMWMVAAPHAEMPEGRGLVLLAATGLAGGLAQIAQTRAYSLESAARVGVFSYAGVVLTQVLAVLIVGEAVSVHTVIGSVAVIGAGLLLMLRPGAVA